MENVKSIEPDFSSSEVIQNIHENYDLLRQKRGSLYKSDNILNGAWLVMGHEDIGNFLNDTEHLSSQRQACLIMALPLELQGQFEKLVNLHSQWFAYYDAPEHTKIRQVMAAGFTREFIQKFENEIADAVEVVLKHFSEKKIVNITEELAKKVPLITITALFGVPLSDSRQLSKWIDSIAAYMGSEKPDVRVIGAAQDSMLEFQEYFKKLYDDRKKKRLGNDLLSRLIIANTEDEILSVDEIFAQCTLIAFKGGEMTKNLISNSIYLMLSEDGVKKELLNDPKLIAKHIDESIRFHSPIQYVGRMVKKDFDYNGSTLKEGDYVSIMLGAGNRDGSVHKNPHTFDIHRDAAPNYAFGTGMHECIGQVIVKMEANVTLRLLLEKYPNIELAEETKWRNNTGLRGLVSVKAKLNNR
ncbi:MAG: cytochrome P450 [Crocinitomix sp.]|nr:cytochrome P450 [Crocinitomix sp.]